MVNIFERLYYKARGNIKKYEHTEKENKQTTKLQDWLSIYMKREGVKIKKLIAIVETIIGVIYYLSILFLFIFSFSLFGFLVEKTMIARSIFYIVGSISLLIFGIGLIFMSYEKGKDIIDLITKRKTNEKCILCKNGFAILKSKGFLHDYKKYKCKNCGSEWERLD